MAASLTVHDVEDQRQNRAAGGSVWDVHGVLPDTQVHRVLVEERLVLQQVLQRDDPTWNQQRGQLGLPVLDTERCDGDLRPGCPPPCSGPWSLCRRCRDPPRRFSGTYRPALGIGRYRFPSKCFSESRRTRSWRETERTHRLERLWIGSERHSKVGRPRPRPHHRCSSLWIDSLHMSMA